MGESTEPPLPEPETPSGDLKKSEAQLFRAGAKLLGVAAVALIPAIVGWIDARSKAATALDATASEKAVSDKAYVKLVDRMNRTEDDLRRMSIELAVVKELVRTGPVLPPVPTTTTTPVLREPVPKLSTTRPKVDKVEVDAAHQAIQLEAK